MTTLGHTLPLSVSPYHERWYCIGRSPPLYVNKQTGMGGSLRQGTVIGGLVISLSFYIMSRHEVVLMLAQHLQCWPHIRQTLVQCLVFKAETIWARQTQDIPINTLWNSAGPTSKMLVQHRTSIAKLLGFARQVSVCVMSGDPVDVSG